MHVRHPSTSALLVTVVLSMLGCSGASDTQPSVTPPPAEAKPSAPPPSTPPPVRDAPPATGLPAEPERVDHITIDPRPRCGPAVDETADAKHEAWLKAPDIQRAVHALNAALQGLENANIGSTLDNERRAVVVVFHSDFRDWKQVRERLVGRIAPLEVVLQPSCRSRAELAEAEQIIKEQAWHPKAKGIRMGSWLDASFSGYRVVIDDSAPEVADALQQRLGERVRVSLGKPRRN